MEQDKDMICFGYCVVIPEEEMDRALAMEKTDGDVVDPAVDIECYIKMGRYDVNGAGEIYDKVTGKYIGVLTKPIGHD